MANLLWLINRLKAMSIPEVLWRLSQKGIQKQEEKRFDGEKTAVTSAVFNSKHTSLQPNADRLRIDFENRQFGMNTSIRLLAGFDYEQYKIGWNAGFQTKNTWPDTFSYKLDYKQRDEIGDARTNWELNRHFQFALLAKDYAASRDEKYLKEFEELFHDWNEKNPFLHGISWTSVMEAAIRCSNWCYSYTFLSHGGAPGELLEELRVGIINMTDYIAGHYSRFSSANNHLIVEAYAIGQSGILFDNREWVDLAVRLLTEELPRQNYSDGVNKEMSLHYQSFYMEAMGLMMRLLIKNGITVPASWRLMLSKMSRYVSDCRGDYGETIVFGDDDEGKILDLQGGEIDHYRYVLGMMSILLDERYTDLEPLPCETLRWLFTSEEIDAAEKKERYISPQYCFYREGGNTILRSRDRKVLIGIDHGALGFGNIAAHGHADALSFQLFYEGRPVFIDPGTYIYHCDLGSRNEFRRTRNHNTVCIDGKDQSEMLGAFLWGRKANAKLLSEKVENGSIELIMEQDGYTPVMHHRRLSFDGSRRIMIEDRVSQASGASVNYMIAPDIDIVFTKESVLLCRSDDYIARMKFADTCYQVDNQETSDIYGIKRATKVLAADFRVKCAVEIDLL